MSFPESRHAQRSIRIALILSLLAHAAILFAPLHPPKKPQPSSRPLTARLAPRVPEPPQAVVEAPAAKAPPKAAVPARRPERRTLVLPPTPKAAPSAPAAEAPREWTKTERDDMNNFLDSLETEARAKPGIAQRALAIASEIGRRSAGQSNEGMVSLERIPGSPPVDPFSLEMYLDALVRKLNRSAAFVKNQPMRAGYRKAAVQVRINPDGTLRSIEVLDAGDQQDHIAFVKALVERASPYSPFPPDIVKSAKSMAIMICIVPMAGAEGGFGFSRVPGGGSC